jgi:hypothetical protein
MKTFRRFLFLLCVFALGYNLASAATNQLGLRLTIELRDGSRVVGQSMDEVLKFKSPLLGELKLAVKDIRSVECATTNSAKLTTAGGDVLTCWFVNSNLRVSTGFGKVDLAVGSVRRLSASTMGHTGRSPEGLVALWSGESNAEDGVGGCNGQLVNGAGFAPGKVGQAFSLNDDDTGNGLYSGGYVQIPASPILDVGKEDGFTITAWIKPTTISRPMLIAEFTGNAGSSISGVCFWISLPPGNGTGAGCVFANVMEEDGACHNVTSAPRLVVPNVWQHIALTYDKTSGLAAIYLNGRSVIEQGIGGFSAKTKLDLLFGARVFSTSTSNPEGIFSGKLDEISIYKRALSTLEIQSICTEQNNGELLPAPAMLRRAY